MVQSPLEHSRFHRDDLIARARSLMIAWSRQFQGFARCTAASCLCNHQ
jgi:hypothetical protein